VLKTPLRRDPGWQPRSARAPPAPWPADRRRAGLPERRQSRRRCQTQDGRRRQRHHRAFADLLELGAQAGNDLRRAERAIFLALLERLERHHQKGGVGLRIIVDEVEAYDDV